MGKLRGRGADSMKYKVSGIFAIEIEAGNMQEAKIKAQHVLCSRKLTWASIITVEEAKE